MRDYPILHGSKSTVETIQFYMEVNQHERLSNFTWSKSTWETIQFYMDVNQQ